MTINDAIAATRHEPLAIVREYQQQQPSLRLIEAGSEVITLQTTAGETITLTFDGFNFIDNSKPPENIRSSQVLLTVPELLLSGVPEDVVSIINELPDLQEILQHGLTLYKVLVKFDGSFIYVNIEIDGKDISIKPENNKYWAIIPQLKKYAKEEF